MEADFRNPPKLWGQKIEIPRNVENFGGYVFGKRYLRCLARVASWKVDMVYW